MGLNFLIWVVGTVTETAMSGAAELSTLMFLGVKNQNSARGKHREGADQFFRLLKQTIKSPTSDLFHCDVCCSQLSLALKRAAQSLQQSCVSTHIPTGSVPSTTNCRQPQFAGAGESRASALPLPLHRLLPQPVTFLKGAF